MFCFTLDGQAAVRDLRGELLLLLGRVRGGQHLEAEVTRSSRSARRLVLRELAEGTVGNDLRPARRRHLGDGRKAVRDVGELEAGRRREITGQLASDLRGDVTSLQEVTHKRNTALLA